MCGKAAFDSKKGALRFTASVRSRPSTEIFDHTGRVCAGGVDQYVYAPEGLDGTSDRLRRLGLACEVHGKG
jgi:hypothetical protein